jgi:hypothetical protein
MVTILAAGRQRYTESVLVASAQDARMWFQLAMSSMTPVGPRGEDYVVYEELLNTAIAGSPGVQDISRLTEWPEHSRPILQCARIMRVARVLRFAVYQVLSDHRVWLLLSVGDAPGAPYTVVDVSVLCVEVLETKACGDCDIGERTDNYVLQLTVWPGAARAFARPASPARS